jgi:predicted ester cyclase
MTYDAEGSIRRLFEEAINNGNIDIVDELIAPDFTTHTPQGVMDRDAFKDYIRAWRAGVPDILCEVQDVCDGPGRIAWRVRATGTHMGPLFGVPGTGRKLDFDSMNFGYYDDDGPHEHFMLMDVMAMMAQLGMAPPVPAQQQIDLTSPATVTASP